MFDDEGYELAKALLMTHQRLYAPVWWDQPPGHPALLQAGAALFGSGVQSFRLVAGLLGVSSLWALAACGSAGRAVAAVCDRRSSSGGSADGSAVADRRYRVGAGLAGWLWAGLRFLPHPGPLPLGEGGSSSPARPATAHLETSSRPGSPPRPAGEGRGEGERPGSLCGSPATGSITQAPLTPSLSPPQRRGEGARRAGEGCGLSRFIAPFAAILLCIFSMGFLSYGLSVTIMLPALGFGLWAVWLWQRFGLSGNRWWLFGSGIVFGLGFQTKFTVLLFLPALAVEFIRHAWRQVPAASSRRLVGSEEGAAAGSTPAPAPSPRPSPLAVQRAREKITGVVGFLSQWSGIWGAGFVYGVALVWAFFPEEDLVWLLKYHFRPEVTGAFQGQAGWSPMLHKLGMDWPIASFAVLGLFLGVVQRRWAVVFPAVFFVTSFLAHAWHRPWWDYYYLHLSIPMAWLGALGVQWTWKSLTRNAERGVRNDPSPRPSPLAAQRAREEGRGEAEGGHRPPLQGWRLREFWPGWKSAGLIAAFSFCLAGFLVELPERYERETAFLHAKPSPTEVKVLAELKERRADTRWLYTDRPIWCAHANILIPPELAVLSLKRIASGDITHEEFLRLLHHYRPEQILLQRRHFEDEKFYEFLRAFYDVVIEEGNLKYLVRRDWEAARKQKRASSSRREEAQLNAEGGMRNAESSERLLTSSPTVKSSPSPRPSPPVGAREKRAVEWVPAAAVSLPSERRLEAAGTWSFASIRVFRGHFGGRTA